MDTKTLIDNALQFTWSTKPSDTLWNQHRLRALLRLQELLQNIWDYDEWDFKETAAQLSVPASFPTQTNQPLATGFVALPNDFDIIGDHGGIYVSGQHQKLKYQAPEIFFRKKEDFSEVSTFPYWYTIYSQNGSLTPLLYVYPTNSIDVLLDIFYTQVRPNLQDSASILPSATPMQAAVANVGGNLSIGSYTYVCTFVGTVPLGSGGSSPSGETNPGAVSTPTVGIANPGAAGQVNLTNIPIGPAGTTARKIYRTNASGFQYFLLTTIGDNVTTSFTDNVANSSLGALAPTVNALLSGIERIPLQYHEAVLLRGLIELLAYDTGDARAQADAKARAMANAAMMKAKRNMSLGDVWGVGDEGLRVWGMHVWVAILIGVLSYVA